MNGTKVVTTIVRLGHVKQGDTVLAELWDYGQSIGLNPAHVVSQEWVELDSTNAGVFHKGQVGKVVALSVRTVLGQTFLLHSYSFL